MEYTLTKNADFGSLEISFSGKPCAEIRDALKALRFRWHGVRRVWYGYADEETTRAALDGVTVGASDPAEQQNRTRTEQPARVLASLWDRCDVSDLPSYGTENDIKKAVREESRAAVGSYDKHVAAYIRKHLRSRFPECRFSVTSGGAGYLNAVNIEIKSSPFSRELVKGDLSAYNNRDRWDHYENAPELDAILKYCEKLLDVFDDDDGDIYADYGARHDLYGFATISYDYKKSEPTAEQVASAADFADRKAEAEAAEEARRAAEWAEREKKQEQERAEAERLEAIRKEQAAEIVGHVEVVDLDEGDRIAVVGLLEACGKENTLEEVRASIAERRAEDRDSRADAVITRKVKFTDPRIFGNFCTMFLRDFDFLEGKGGTASDDVRLSEDVDPYRLNDRQRESVKFYLCDCIGVYLDDVFQFVIDPQGFDYARYVLIPDDMTDSYKASEKLDEWREASEQLPPFHFPAPISEQITEAALQPGEAFTMLYIDPWIMTATTTSGTVNGWSVTDYAQYRNVARLNYTTIGKRKTESVHIKDGETCAIWRGILPDVPDTIKYSNCGGGLQQVNYSGETATDYVINAIQYYKSIGFLPVVDTIQR